MPASLTYPGVYIEELPSNVHTIAGVATSIAAFIGWAPQGPTGQAVLVESFTQFQSVFGGFTPGIYLAYAVNQFFANGGTEAYVIRLAWDGSLPPAPGTNPAVAATAVAAGVGFPSAQITASVGSVVSPPVTVDVGAPALQSLVIGPPNLPAIPLGTQVTLVASGVFADGSTGALSGPVAWSSSGPAISVSPTGVATANSVGSAVVTAKSGLLSISTTLTVGGVSVASLTLNPSGTFSLAAGQTQQLSAIATLSDGTTQDVTPMVSWTLPADVTISPSGLATPKSGATGSEAISASLATVGGPIASSAVTADLGPGIPVSLAVYPAGAVANAGQTIAFGARVTNSDGGIGVPSSGTWSSSNTTIATIIAATGVATLAGTGTTVITVTSGSLSASATLTVTPATLKAISVTPLSSTVASGQSVQLSATGLYSDGTAVDLTQSVSWTPATAIPPPSPPTTNTVDPNTELVTTGAPGVTTAITATVPWQTATTASVNVTVTAPVVASIAITPPSPLLSGQSVALTATATLSDGSKVSPVPGAKWLSSAPAIVSVNGATGVATAVAGGGSLTLFANSPGAWGNSLLVSVLPQPSDPTRFGLLVQQQELRADRSAPSKASSICRRRPPIRNTRSPSSTTTRTPSPSSIRRPTPRSSPPRRRRRRRARSR